MKINKYLMIASILTGIMVLYKAVLFITAPSPEQMKSKMVVSRYEEGAKSGKNVILYFSKTPRNLKERRALFMDNTMKEAINSFKVIPIMGIATTGAVDLKFTKNATLSQCTERLCIINPKKGVVMNLNIENIDSYALKTKLQEFLNY